MQELKCPMCGAGLEKHPQNPLSLVCAYCGTTLQLPQQTGATRDIRSDADFKNALYGEHVYPLLRYIKQRLADGAFTEAGRLAENLVRTYPDVAEGYWLMLLAAYKAPDDEALAQRKHPIANIRAYSVALAKASSEEAERWAAIARQTQENYDNDPERLMGSARDKLGLNAAALQEGIAICDKLPQDYPGVTLLREQLEAQYNRLVPPQPTPPPGISRATAEVNNLLIGCLTAVLVLFGLALIPFIIIIIGGFFGN